MHLEKIKLSGSLPKEAKDLVSLIDQLFSQNFVNSFKEMQNQRVQVTEELYVVGQLLDRFYINSTDIEYAQFYNKELTLRLDLILNQLKLEEKFEFKESLKSEVNEIFRKIEQKKENHMSSCHKEISSSKKNKEDEILNLKGSMHMLARKASML